MFNLAFKIIIFRMKYRGREVFRRSDDYPSDDHWYHVPLDMYNRPGKVVYQCVDIEYGEIEIQIMFVIRPFKNGYGTAPLIEYSMYYDGDFAEPYLDLAYEFLRRELITITTLRLVSLCPGWYNKVGMAKP